MMRRPSNKQWVAALVALAASGCSQVRPISEADVLEYASAPYEKAGYGSPRRVLGALNDAHVVVDFVCSDLCPSNTVRIIHYDLEPGARCAAVGGVERKALVPVAITARLQTFCVPAVLADTWAAYLR